ncbi:MAG: ABC transporter permease [Saccharofermentans sp.]|nr:ABC transporter permease [Saccharofermentans sp.]
MARNKIKNPLLKRVPREFLGDWKKYIVVMIFLTAMIGVTAGVYVANNSMMAMFDTLEDDYSLEDGHFELQKKATPELLLAIESGEMADIRKYYEDEISEEYGEKFLELYSSKIDEEVTKAEEKYGLDDEKFEKVSVTIYENFYVNLDENDESRIRVFKYQENVDLPCIHNGRLPEADDEIAIDRMHADNANIKLGDVINVGGSEMEVVGFISLANYTTLHENNSDMMFNALTFDVALVNNAGFEKLSSNRNIHYMYSWIYNVDPEDKLSEAKASDNFMKALITQVACSDNSIEDYVPAYSNQAINFAPEDVGGDMSMVGILLYIFIGIIAFIFAVTISSTIVKESAVIGTLRASGYTKGELIAHYMAMPLIVTLLSGVIGNVIGYTFLKNAVKALYYNSYSLPVYKTLWSSEAFLKTTLIPVVVVLLVNFIVIAYKMRLSPLKFLRHDLKSGKRRNTIKLPNWGFLSRFRTRILIQNKTNYIILAFGIIFVMFLMEFAYGMPDALDNIKKTVPESLFVNYQVVLKSTEDDDDNEITTSNSDAERFAMGELIYKTKSLDEGISVYGLVDDSKYFSLPELSDGEVVISEAFSDKYGINVGDTINLDAEFENTTYEFKVFEIRPSTSMAIFMNINTYNSLFGLDDDNFTGYFSNTEITDIEEKYIAMTITEEDMIMMANQLDHSMGGMMKYFSYICVIMAAVLIYLLTKVIIEKNENAISMTKILGYKTNEIASLYLMSTTWVMIAVELVGVFAGRIILGYVWGVFLKSMPGWVAFDMNNSSLVKIFFLVLVAYFAIMGLDYRRIRKIPMDEALKRVE